MIRNVSLVNGQTDRLALPYKDAYVIGLQQICSRAFPMYDVQSPIPRLRFKGEWKHSEWNDSESGFWLS
jgi:hypothetical protein